MQSGMAGRAILHAGPGHRFDDEQPGTGFIGRNETEENYCPGCWVAVKQAWLDEARAELH